MRYRIVATACACASLFAFSSATSAAAEPKLGTWGVDLAGRDEQVRPGADFYQYANGRWLAQAQIPADRSTWGSFDQLAVQAEERLRQIIESLPAAAPAGSVERKVGDFYRAFLDTQAIGTAGLEPAAPVLRDIASATTHAQIARITADPTSQLAAPVRFSITIDQKNPDRYIVDVAHARLSLPNRDYYLKSEPSFVKLREAFLEHVARMLVLAGEKDAQKTARIILDHEIEMARHHWPSEKRREKELTYNLMTLKELSTLAPRYPWHEALAGAGFAGQKQLIVRETTAIAELSDHFVQTPLSTWKIYLKYRYLAANAELLPEAFATESFNFYGRTLNGQPEQKARWKLAVAATNDALGEALGQLYVRRYFPPESKAAMEDLVKNLRAAYAQRIERLSWMTPRTRAAALEKLAAFRPKIGYPDRWRDHSALDVQPNDAFGNAIRSRRFDYERRLTRIDQPTDREEWAMPPQTVNAYYDGVFNQIVFAAAILQPPFFDPHADPAVNYGGIGAVIGHELGHGFDDQGAKFDARGRMRDWWQADDWQAFRALGDRLVGQYDRFEPLPGLNVRGRLTLGENIGDLGGLSVAYEAYKLSLQGKSSAVLSGMSGEQRFFLSWAQVWRMAMREERLRNQLMRGPHSPPKYRVNGVVRNMDAWYAAFDVKPGDAMYLPPEDRVRIW